jgi:hypothetical protein
MVAPFDAEGKKAELIARLRAEAGWSLEADAKYPGMQLVDVAQGDRLEALLRVMDWVLAETQARS